MSWRPLRHVLAPRVAISPTHPTRPRAAAVLCARADGDTFTVVCLSTPCDLWRLRSLKTGGWLSVTRDGSLSATLDTWFLRSDEHPFVVTRPAQGWVQLQSYVTGGWLALSHQGSTAEALAPSATGTLASASADSIGASTPFEVVDVPFIRGVNLGALFVPERWMVPSFYRGSEATSLCGFVRSDEALAAERMRAHLATFIAEPDLEWIAHRGFNAVRVPVGWWTALGAPRASGAYFVPRDAAESLAVLDQLFEWSHTHGLRLLLDMHGAVSSQNGADHSGCDDEGIGWGDDEASVDGTLRALQVLVDRYGAHPALLGFEFLNEPAWKVEWNHGSLLDFYMRAYGLVRAASATALCVFNVLYSAEFPAGFGNWYGPHLRACSPASNPQPARRARTQ